MITTVINEAPFQVLTSSFSISPSTTGYDLEISADGINYSKLFTVSSNTTKLVTNVASGSYYRLKGNEGTVKINWRTSCSDGSGGGGDLSNYYTKSETDAAIDAAISGITVDLSGYYTSAQTETAIAAATEDFITSAETAQQIEAYNYTTSAETEQQISDAIADVVDTFSGITSGLTAELSEVERVTSTAINSLRQDVNTISGATANVVTSNFGSGHNVTSIWQGTQDDYNMLTQSGATADATTFYIIKNNPSL